MFFSTAYDILLKELELQSISTHCYNLDKALGNGIQPGIITEFTGAPGTSKTQMCIQLCVNVQLPRKFGGLEAKAIYIDTNHGFTLERYKQIAYGSLAKHFTDNSNKDLDLKFAKELLMNNLLYSYVSNYIELLAALQNAKELISSTKDIKLLIIDSFSFLLRTNAINKVEERMTLLCHILTELQTLAEKNNLAIIITNELTTCGNTIEESYTAPCFGQSHQHMVSQRITFGKSKEKNQFIAKIDKSLYCREAEIYFEVKSEGIL